MKICSVCRRCCEDGAADCQENHGSLAAARAGSRQMIAGYRLDFLLERDAAGESYQATRHGFDQPFIVEILAPTRIGDTEQLEKIQSETGAAATLNHLNIARVYESGALGDGEFYFVTEMVGGRTLRDCLRSGGAFSEAEAVTIARHAAEALEAAHRVCVVHRAVSPTNILLAQDGQKSAVKLCNFDFGGVRQQIAVAAVSETNPPIETLRYLAPEQCAGQAADARSDIYSLAVVLYEMLCGRSPFGAPTSAALSDRRINEQPLEQLSFDTRALVRHILRQSLQKRPEARPQTAGNFARQLRHIEQLLGLSLAAAAAPARAASPALTANELPFEKSQAREVSSQEIVAPIQAAIPFVVSPLEETEETATNADAAFPETEQFRGGETQSRFDSFSAEPILIKKKAANVYSPESEPVAFEKRVEKEFESEPIAVRKKQVETAPLEFAPIFVRRKSADTVLTPTPETIDLGDADVRETAPTQTTAPILADSLDENRGGRRFSPPNIRSLFVGAGLLALLASVLLGALLYKRQHQTTAVAPTTIAAEASPVDGASPPQKTASDVRDARISDATKTDAAELEKPASASIEKSPATASKRQNQSREQPPTDSRAATKQNESPADQTARANPTTLERKGDHAQTRGASAGGDAQAELNNSLAQWISATNSRNVERQMNYYAPRVNAYYLTRNVSPDAVRAEKKRIFERADRVDIQTGKPDIAVGSDGKTATMRFRKKYVIKEGIRNRSGEVIQELQWVKSGDNWRIVSERDVRVISH